MFGELVTADERKIDRLENDLAKMEKKHDALLDEMRELGKKHDRRLADVDQARGERDNYKAERDTLQEELDAAKEQRDAYRGEVQLNQDVLTRVCEVFGVEKLRDMEDDIIELQRTASKIGEALSGVVHLADE